MTENGFESRTGYYSSASENPVISRDDAEDASLAESVQVSRGHRSWHRHSRHGHLKTVVTLLLWIAAAVTIMFLLTPPESAHPSAPHAAQKEGTTTLGGRDRRTLLARRKHAICTVFGPRYCQEALRVAWCESRWNPAAVNGQFKGTFQMGAAERARYGHGSGAWRQARAARRYFIASGRDWSPWSCRP